MEGVDDRRLHLARQERFEPQRLHAFDQDVAVLRISLAAAGLTTLGPEFLERLMERHDHVDGRGEAILPGLEEGLPLIIEIEDQCRCIALGCL